MDTAVIGGGLAGLAAAIELAGNGHQVTVFERRAAVGGRARTRNRDGYCFNLGPHALYGDGAAEASLTSWGIKLAGGDPLAAEGDRVVFQNGRGHLLPIGPWTMLRTSLMPFGSKLKLARLFASLPKLVASDYRGQSVDEFVAAMDPAVATLVRGVIQLKTYVNSGDLDAELAVAYLKRERVSYLDGGWQTMVAALRDVAVERGVGFGLGQKIDRVLSAHDGVSLRVDGERLRFDGCVVATSPKAAGALLDCAFAVKPAFAASLSLGLSSELPRQASEFGRAPYAMGLDDHLYYAAHQDAASLAPQGAQMVHVQKYLPVAPGGSSAEAVDHRAQLESLMDRMQPGWREVLVHAVYHPKLMVIGDVACASTGGLLGRQSVRTEHPSIMLAGDWVGADGNLADACFASGREAATLLSTTVTRAA